MLKGIGTVAVICTVLLGLLAHQAAQADEIYIRGGGGPQPVTISNIGDVGSVLEVTDIFIDDDTHFSLVSGGTCDSPPFSLTAGEDCTWMVDFTPQEVGEHAATLQVLSDAGSINNDTVVLNGTASPGPQPEITITPDPLSFGLVDSSALPVFDDFTVTNTGDPDTSFTITNLVLFDDNAFFIDTDGCAGMALTDGESCTITIGLDTSENRSFSGELTVQTDQGDASADILATTQIPQQLAFVVHPSLSMVNDIISPAVVIEVRDSDDNPVTLDNDTVVEVQLTTDPSGQAELGGTLQRQVSDGQAVFDDLSIDQVGESFVLSAAAAGLTGDDSLPFDVIAGTPAGLAFVDQPPALTTVGEAFATSVTVEVLDSFGNRVEWDSTTEVELALSGGNPAAELGDGGARTVISGMASFSGLNVDQASENYQLIVSDTAETLGTDGSSLFEIGRALSTTEITGIDPEGSQVIGQTYTVTVGVTGFNPTGTVSVTDGNGASCQIELPASSCELISTSTGARNIAAIYPGDDNNLPSSDTAAYDITQASAEVNIVSIDPEGSQAVNQPYFVEVEVSGYLPIGTVTVDDGDGASCQFVLSNGNGCSLTSTSVGTRTITASYPGDDNNLGDEDSTTYEIVSGAPVSLHFIVQPSTTVSNVIIDPAVEVQVRDSDGNPVIQDDETQISLALIDGVTGGQLSGGEAVTVDGGVAVFDALSVDLAASDYRLRATATGLSEAFSLPFDIVHGDPAQLAFGAQPSTTQFDAVITPAVTVEILDAVGNLVLDDNATVVSLELTGGEPFAVLSNGGATQAENGVVTFAALSVDLVGTGYQLIASDSLGSLGTDTSNAFNITSLGSMTTIETIAPESSQVVGQPYTVTVEVSVTGVDPTGQVTVSDGAGESCTFNLPNDSCELTSIVAGLKTITAFYSGDENYASSSDADDYQINQAGSTVIIDGFDPTDEQVVNQPYQVQVSVSGFEPTGTVLVSDDGDNECTIILPASGCNLTSTSVGTRTITATYSGDTNNTDSQASTTYEIVRAQTSLTILGITPPGQQFVDELYEVTISIGGQSPTGQVEVNDGEGASCIIDLDADETSCQLVSTTHGERTITASYPGDANNQPSEDTRQYEIVTSGPAALVFAVEPQLGVLDGPMIPRVVIQVVDSQGMLVTDDNETEIQIVFETNPTNAELSGNPLLSVTNGSVEFPDLSIDRLGQGYQLRAQTPKQALQPALSSPFDVVEDSLFSDRFEKVADELFHDRFER